MAQQPRTRKAPSTRGDFTGNLKAKQAAEHEDVVAARREEIGLLNQTQQQVKDEGVIDMMGQSPKLTLDNPDLETALAEQLATRGDMSGVEGDGRDGPVADATDTRIDVDTSGREPTPVAPQTPAPAQGTKIGGSTATAEVYEIEPERPKAGLRAGEVASKDRLNERTRIRVLFDLEDVTIGYGNNFTFREGWQYDVPRWIAMHLEEKGLCDVLSLSLA